MLQPFISLRLISGSVWQCCLVFINTLYNVFPFFLSVTADKWVPIVEVPVGSMKAFLEKKKQESYAILGLEQTANSIPMDQYNFPERTVSLHH